MDVSRFTRDELILAGIALLLAIDLLFLPWFDISIGIGAFKVSTTSGATESPDGWLGVLAVLAMMAYLALERLGNVELPAITGSPATTRFALARRGFATTSKSPSRGPAVPKSRGEQKSGRRRSAVPLWTIFSCAPG